MPKTTQNIVRLARSRADSQPDGHAYTFLSDGEREGATLTWAQLDRRARVIAARLQELDASGARAILAYPPGVELVAALFGCLYAETTPIPTLPPEPQNPQRTAAPLAGIASDSGATLMLTDAELLRSRASFVEAASQLGELQWIATDGELSEGDGAGYSEVDPAADALAYLQYTSGSTGTPKGVMISHANVMHQCAFLQHSAQYSDKSVGLTWVPTVHDLGLFIGVWEPLYCGYHSLLMSPVSFIERPVRWLRAMTKYGGTHSGGPNFGFDLCVRNVAEQQREGLDLSAWRSAHNGAERVRVETLHAFDEAYKPHGFRWKAFQACCGLAEATLRISGTPYMAGPTDLTVDAGELEKHVVLEAAEGQRSLTLVGHGPQTPLKKVIVVEPDARRELPEDRVGEVWVQGPDVALGYFNREEETQAKFGATLADKPDGGSWLRSGDLGFYHDGLLYLTGRIKEMIIIRGRNHYPPDIESTAASSHAAVIDGAVAAFGVEAGDEEQLVVAAEIERRESAAGAGDDDDDAIINAIRRAIADRHETQVHTVLLLRPGTIPKTAAGKVKRRAVRGEYIDETLDPIAVASRGRAAAPDERVQLSQLVSGAIASLDADDVAAVRSALDKMQQLLAASTPQGPRDERERILVDVWRRILGVEQVGIHDDFLALGGDSLTSIQMAAAANDAGLAMMPYHIEKYSTVAELAAALAGAKKVEAEQGLITGPVQLLPTQHVCLTLDDPGHFTTLYRTYRAHARIDVERLERVVQRLIEHHDSLRARFRRGPDGWQQEIAPPSGRRVVETLDLSAMSEEEQGVALERKVRPMHRFELEQGPLVRMVVVNFGDHDKLFSVIHHLATDVQSDSIFYEDLIAQYERLGDGEDFDLPPKTSSIRDWCQKLIDLGQSGLYDDEVSYWTSKARHAAPRALPRDFPEGHKGKWPVPPVMFFLPPPIAAKLRARVLSIGATLNDLFTTGVAAALQNWYGPSALMNVLDSARTSDVDGVDLRRTMGFIAVRVPWLVQVPAGASPDDAILSVRDQLARIPNKGLGYNVLRYFGAAQLRDKLAALPQPAVVYEFFGDTLETAVETISAERPHRLAVQPRPFMHPVVGPKNRPLADIVIPIDAFRGGFRVRLIFNPDMLERTTVEGVAERLKEELARLEKA